MRPSFVVGVTLVSLAAAAADPPAAKPLTAEQKDKLKERDRLSEKAEKFEKAGKLAEAVAMAEKMLAIEREVLGDAHPDIVGSWELLTQLNRNKEDWPAAGNAAEAWLMAAQATFGPGDWRATDARLSVADIGRVAGLTTADRSRLNDAALLMKKATAFRLQSSYAEAAGLVERALAIRRKLLGGDHPNTATSLYNLAGLYQAQGRYADAEPLYKDALAARRKTLGNDHPLTAGSQNNLAFLYQAQGRYADAEPLYKGALIVYRKSLGDAHPDTALSQNCLAGLYEAQGRYADAEPLFREALAARRKTLGDDHPLTAQSRNDLAHLYEAQGRYAEAEPLFREALAARRKTLGDDHPLTAQSRNGLAHMYQTQGRYADAEPLFRANLAVYRKTFGDAHSYTSASRNNLALLYKDQGRYADAEPLFREALAVYRKTLGDAHPDTALSQSNLARLFQAQGRIADAEPLAGNALTSIADHLDETSAIQSETAQLSHLAASRTYHDSFLTCTPIADPAASYTGVLRWQGAVTARQSFARAARATDSVAHDTLTALTAITRQLVNLENNPPPPSQKINVPAKLKELHDQRADLEAKLAARSASFDRYVKNRALTPADLQRTLPVDVALVNYVGYYDKLAAFVVRRDTIARIELGDAKPVAAAADEFRQTLLRPRPTTRDPDDPGPRLRKLIWEPLAKPLAGATTVLVCPDGPLCRVPFAALPGANPDKYLLEEVAVAVAPVPRLLPELLADRPARPTGPPTLLAVGDVDFDTDHAPAPVPALGEKRVRAGGPKSWRRLPGTAGEADDLAAAFRAAVPGGKLSALREKDATEEAVRDQLGKHAYVHLATHGFFADPADSPAPAPDRGGMMTDARPRPTVHPGLLCGVVLAGANKPKGADDGVLTALEVGDLDLAGVELAVLSACETGLGEVAGGEGVLGLQRAFQVAGARATVTSLWKVDDAATRALMGRFYAGLWADKRGPLAALRAAQLDVLANGRANGLSKEADPDPGDPRPARTPPLYWAAFTLAGDWR